MAVVAPLKPQSFALLPPINLQKFIDEHKDTLRPPVCNTCMYKEGEFIIMIVGGPNRRSDFHINEGNEIFYQIKGEMLLKICDNGEFKDIVIKEGELFLLASNVPHNPIRFADTIGMVIERQRTADELDRMRWYCENPACNPSNIVHQAEFHCEDIGAQIKAALEEYHGNETLRTCKVCGGVNPVPPPAVNPNVVA